MEEDDLEDYDNDDGDDSELDGDMDQIDKEHDIDQEEETDEEQEKPEEAEAEAEDNKVEKKKLGSVVLEENADDSAQPTVAAEVEAKVKKGKPNKIVDSKPKASARKNEQTTEEKKHDKRKKAGSEKDSGKVQAKVVKAKAQKKVKIDTIRRDVLQDSASVEDAAVKIASADAERLAKTQTAASERTQSNSKGAAQNDRTFSRSSANTSKLLGTLKEDGLLLKNMRQATSAARVASKKDLVGVEALAKKAAKYAASVARGSLTGHAKRLAELEARGANHVLKNAEALVHNLAHRGSRHPVLVPARPRAYKAKPLSRKIVEASKPKRHQKDELHPFAVAEEALVHEASRDEVLAMRREIFLDEAPAKLRHLTETMHLSTDDRLKRTMAKTLSRLAEATSRELELENIHNAVVKNAVKAAKMELARPMKGNGKGKGKGKEKGKGKGQGKGKGKGQGKGKGKGKGEEGEGKDGGKGKGNKGKKAGRGNHGGRGKTEGGKKTRKGKKSMTKRIHTHNYNLPRIPRPRHRTRRRPLQRPHESHGYWYRDHRRGNGQPFRRHAYAKPWRKKKSRHLPPGPLPRGQPGWTGAQPGMPGVNPGIGAQPGLPGINPGMMQAQPVIAGVNPCNPCQPTISQPTITQPTIPQSMPTPCQCPQPKGSFLPRYSKPKKPKRAGRLLGVRRRRSGGAKTMAQMKKRMTKDLEAISANTGSSRGRRMAIAKRGVKKAKAKPITQFQENEDSVRRAVRRFKRDMSRHIKRVEQSYARENRMQLQQPSGQTMPWGQPQLQSGQPMSGPYTTLSSPSSPPLAAGYPAPGYPSAGYLAANYPAASYRGPGSAVAGIPEAGDSRVYNLQAAHPVSEIPGTASGEGPAAVPSENHRRSGTSAVSSALAGAKHSSVEVEMRAATADIRQASLMAGELLEIRNLLKRVRRRALQARRLGDIDTFTRETQRSRLLHAFQRQLATEAAKQEQLAQHLVEDSRIGEQKIEHA
eukprot:TRINITY_DN12942_c0_g1_i1.p1 TRINITY_DN12942_c0_g1~~TRINITY_DN12942_c0_g1_i1.p1  ORF type:complete len:1109 (-),score=179.87 TRINITY_DN12942_c0_g1_i1:133-3090(-)